jgi:hypothetical protein
MDHRIAGLSDWGHDPALTSTPAAQLARGHIDMGRHFVLLFIIIAWLSTANMWVTTQTPKHRGMTSYEENCALDWFDDA